MDKVSNIACWTDYADTLSLLLTKLEVTDSCGACLNQTEAFRQWAGQTLALADAHSMYLAGNGASASLASHFAADLTKNADVPAHVLTDPALITAISNDIGYEEGFSVLLQRYMRAGDMLAVISSSGNSPNIVNACRSVRRLGGYIVTVSAMQPDNAVRQFGDLNFYMPASTYSLAESAHAAVLHYWLDGIIAAGEKRIVA